MNENSFTNLLNTNPRHAALIKASCVNNIEL